MEQGRQGDVQSSDIAELPSAVGGPDPGRGPTGNVDASWFPGTDGRSGSERGDIPYRWVKATPLASRTLRPGAMLMSWQMSASAKAV